MFADYKNKSFKIYKRTAFYLLRRKSMDTTIKKRHTT